MANRITGSTDTTGAISVRPRSAKSLLLVCKSSAVGDGVATPNTIYTITGTADANAKFGETASKLVKILINNGVDNSVDNILAKSHQIIWFVFVSCLIFAVPTEEKWWVKNREEKNF